MLNDIIIQILPQVLFSIITIIMGFIAAIAKQWWNAHKGFMEVQKQRVVQAIGIEKYASDVGIAKQLINSVEEQARNFDWDSTIKHAMATKLISSGTGLTTDQIYNIIKATVNELKVAQVNTAPVVKTVATEKIIDSTNQIMIN
jgi:hypothetical protein